MRHMKKDEPFTREQLLRAFHQPPPAFDTAVLGTLRHVTKKKEAPFMKRKLTLALCCVLALALLAGAACAVVAARTADRFGTLYGEEKQAQLEAGDTAQVSRSHTLGDVTYTVTDVVYADGALYGTVVVEPREGANVVLLPEDYEVSDKAGYDMYSDDPAPADAKSYADLARKKDAKILLATCVPNGYLVDGELICGDLGYFFSPQRDGSIHFSFELHGLGEAIAPSPDYTLQFYLASWEVTPDGTHLRQSPDDTRIHEDWDVTVTPESAL